MVLLNKTGLNLKQVESDIKETKNECKKKAMIKENKELKEANERYDIKNINVKDHSTNILPLQIW